MSEMKYTETHEWVRLEDGGVAACGITDYAQDQLGELVYVELPEVDQEVAQGDDIAVIESVKAAGELKAPVSGTVTERNEALIEEPGAVNTDPTGAGWFVKLRLGDAGQLDALMDQAAYDSYTAGLD